MSTISGASSNARGVGPHLSSPTLRPRHSLILMSRCLSSSDCCGPGTSGHCSSPTGDCIQIPGTYHSSPRQCSNISLFDSAPEMAAVQRPFSSIYRGTPCSTRGFTLRALQSYSNTWLTRTHRANRRWHHVPQSFPVSWRGCFGCGAKPDSQCCSGRGQCVHGLCSCQRGASGVDCAHAEPPQQPMSDDKLSLSSSSSSSFSPSRRARTTVAIYVYDLP